MIAALERNESGSTLEGRRADVHDEEVVKDCAKCGSCGG